MLAPWLNLTVKIQRRSGTSRNSLNEPDWGTDASLPIAYASVYCRIEYVDMQISYNEQGERVNLGAGTYMFLEPETVVYPQDRVTILTADDPALINKLYLITAVFDEWNAVGNLHHHVCQLSIH